MSASDEVKMRCPNCGQKAKGKPSLLQKKITCPACKNLVMFKQVPLESPTNVTPPAATPQPVLKLLGQCPDCNVRIKANESAFKQAVTCPRCKHKVLLRQVASPLDTVASVSKDIVDTGMDAAKKLFSFGKKVYQEHQEQQRVRAEQERIAAERRRPHFLGKTDTFRFMDKAVYSPFVYVAESGLLDHADASLICTQLPIASPCHEPDRSMGYWPHFSGITPHQRGTYLQWLANGRSDPDIDVGYVFIYFYGLERRTLIDNNDCEDIAKELMRLLEIYGGNRSFRGYASGLLFHLLALQRINLTPQLLKWMFESEKFQMPLELPNYLLSYLAQCRASLPVEYAFVFAKADERAKRSLVAQRAGDELANLFALRFNNQFSTDLVPALGNSITRLEYRPASPSLLGMDDGGLSAHVLPKATFYAVNRWKSRFSPVVKIYNECLEELKPYSSKAGSAGRDSLKAYEALPEDLRLQTEHPLQDKWEALLEEHMPDNGPVLLPVSQLAGFREIRYQAKLTQSQSKSLAELVDSFDACIEPDVRFTRSAYEWNDKVAILKLSRQPKIPGTQGYALTSLLLPLALHVAQADGEIEDSELAVIREFLGERFMLNENEMLRLDALIHVLRSCEIQLKGVKTKLARQFSPTQLSAIAKFLIMIAGAGDGICMAEVDALRETFKLLGQSPDLADHYIQELGYEHPDQPVLVEEATSSTGAEAIPAEDNNTEIAIELDYGEILRKRRESELATARLMQAFTMSSDDEPEENQADAPTAGLAACHPVQIPHKLRGFYSEIIEKSEWSKPELGEIAARHSTTFTAAVDQLNEIFMEHFDDPLLDGEGPWVLYQDEKILREIAHANH